MNVHKIYNEGLVYDFICQNDTGITQLKLVMRKKICRIYFLPENSLIFLSEAKVYLFVSQFCVTWRFDLGFVNQILIN